MFSKILIANRGEIACRIIRTARAMGVATVAVYSDADREALHVALADEAVRLGPGPASESYLRTDRVIAAAQSTGALAIHPGYGFLAENPDFATACADAGVVFIGPSPGAMRSLGGKAEAKRLAGKAGVPIVPGYQGEAQDAATLAHEAEAIGYPVMIKAVAGGGGRGMRLVREPKAFPQALDSATREAAAAFGNPAVLVEKVIVAPRHIEVQVFGDTHGNVVHMFERDCTLQRRNQKVIEEAPAPGMSPALRDKMTTAAVALAKSVGYEGAGTIEFLVEGGQLDADASWYFIEMNTRLQVEHPVTEEITGLDLVEWQLRVAAGEPLPCRQAEITMQNHAIEARVCAEDPARDFAPSTGRIVWFETHGDDNKRVETGVREGSEISPFYDSLIAKLICIGPDRVSTCDRLANALAKTEILGLKTNLAFLHALLRDDDVRAGRMTTSLIAEKIDALIPQGTPARAIGEAVSSLLAADRDAGRRQCDDTGPWAANDAFQLGGEARSYTRPVTVDGQIHEIELVWDGKGQHDVRLDGASCTGPASPDESDVERDMIASGGMICLTDRRTAIVLDDMRHTEVGWPVYHPSDDALGGSADAILAPINGRLAKIYVAEGETVEENQPLAIVEAMKMEHVLKSPRAGVIADIAFAEGSQVTERTVLITLTPQDSEGSCAGSGET